MYDSVIAVKAIMSLGGGGVKALKYYGENSHDDCDCAHRQGPKLITPCDREIFRVPVFHVH